MARGTVFYLHGFNSSPQSAKARQVSAYLTQQAAQFAAHGLQIDYIVPTLPFEPFSAINVIEAAIIQANATHIGILGSSLGGFYATYIAEVLAARFSQEKSIAAEASVKAVVINPAVRPFELLENYLGEQLNPYTGECYELNRTHIEQLKALEINEIQHRENFLLLAQTGDEVLDYRQAEQKYAGCKQIIEVGGSHAFDQFEQHLPAILKFFEFTSFFSFHSL